MLKITDGTNENFIKSWSPTLRLSSYLTNTGFPLSAAATGKQGSPTFTLCL